jgi:hypothetical protein
LAARLLEAHRQFGFGAVAIGHHNRSRAGQRDAVALGVVPAVFQIAGGGALAAVEIDQRGLLAGKCQSNADMRISTPAANQNLCDANPGEGNFGVAGAKLVFPGDPARSLVSLRMKRLAAGRMPLLGSNVVDDVGTDVCGFGEDSSTQSSEY